MKKLIPTQTNSIELKRYTGPITLMYNHSPTRTMKMLKKLLHGSTITLKEVAGTRLKHLSFFNPDISFGSVSIDYDTVTDPQLFSEYLIKHFGEDYTYLFDSMYKIGQKRIYHDPLYFDSLINKYNDKSIAIPLGFDTLLSKTLTTGHENGLFINRELKLIELYEPNGYVKWFADHIYVVNTFGKKFFKQVPALEGYTFCYIPYMFRIKGPQSRSRCDEDDKYCVIYSIIYLCIRSRYPKMKLADFVDKFYNLDKSSGIRWIDIARRFVAKYFREI